MECNHNLKTFDTFIPKFGKSEKDYFCTVIAFFSDRIVLTRYCNKPDTIAAEFPCVTHSVTTHLSNSVFFFPQLLLTNLIDVP